MIFIRYEKFHSITTLVYHRLRSFHRTKYTELDFIVFRTYRKILGIRVLSRLHFAREASHNLVSLAMKKRNTQQVQNVSGLIICSRAYVHAADVYYSPAIPLRRILVEYWTSRVVHVNTYHRQKQSADPIGHTLSWRSIIERESMLRCTSPERLGLCRAVTLK